MDKLLIQGEFKQDKLRQLGSNIAEKKIIILLKETARNN